MTDSEHTPRRYTEKEVGIILRRATEMQTSEPSAANPSGFSLADLEEIADEAGIDVRFLRQAAAELETVGPSTLGVRLAGAPVTIRLERTVPGELPEGAFDELIPLIQMAMEGHGQASSVGKTLTWSSRTASQTSSQQVLVSSNRGETLIRIEEGLGGLAGGLFGGILGGVGGGVGLGVGGAIGGVLGSVAFGVGFPIVVIGASYFASRKIFAAMVARRRRVVETLMERIVERVREGVARLTIGEVERRRGVVEETEEPSPP